MARDKGTTQRKSSDYSTLIKACLLLAIGVLFCISPSTGESLLSRIVGIGFIVMGVVYCLLSLKKDKSLLTAAALGGVLAVALGVYIVVVNAVGMIVEFVPYLLITYGVLMVIDSFLGKYWRKSSSTLTFVVKLLLGIAGVALGICLLTVDSFRRFSSFVFGVTLVVISVFIISYTVSGKKSAKA